jgi:hypothetical protein
MHLFDAASVIALVLAVVIAASVTTTLIMSERPFDHRRIWRAGGILAVVLIALGLLDVFTRSPRELTPSVIVLGAATPILGSIGIIYGTRRVKPWVRWILVFVTAFLLLFVGLIFGATTTARYLGF